MAYVPDMKAYKPFYIQAADDTAATDTATAYGLVAKTNPFFALPEPKTPYTNDWKDENGDDEYTEQMFYQSFTFTVEFLIMVKGSETAASDINSQLREFFGKISSGEFMVYDAYTGIGFRKVRLSGCKNDNIEFKARDDWAYAFIEVEFKVNDPVTKVYLSDSGALVADADDEDEEA